MLVKWEYKSTRIEYNLTIVNSGHLNHDILYYIIDILSLCDEMSSYV